MTYIECPVDMNFILVNSMISNGYDRYVGETIAQGQLGHGPWPSLMLELKIFTHKNNYKKIKFTFSYLAFFKEMYFILILVIM